MANECEIIPKRIVQMSEAANNQDVIICGGSRVGKTTAMRMAKAKMVETCNSCEHRYGSRRKKPCVECEHLIRASFYKAGNLHLSTNKDT